MCIRDRRNDEGEISSAFLEAISRAVATAAALHDNPYFPMLTRREFRRWVPAFRADLLTMVRQLDGFAARPDTRSLRALATCAESIACLLYTSRCV